MFSEMTLACRSDPVPMLVTGATLEARVEKKLEKPRMSGTRLAFLSIHHNYINKLTMQAMAVGRVSRTTRTDSVCTLMDRVSGGHKLVP